MIVPLVALAFGDVDADGDLDLIVANMNSPNELWINNGAGVFNRRSTFDAGGTAATTAVAFGDVNGDGALDVVFSNTNNQANTLLLNDEFVIAIAMLSVNKCGYFGSLKLANAMAAPVQGEREKTICAHACTHVFKKKKKDMRGSR